MTTKSLLFLSLIALALAPSFRAAATAYPRAEAQLCVTVVDSDGLPVNGLDGEDFSLREGAYRQAVLGVSRAQAPLAVAVLALGFDAADRDALATTIAKLRDGLAAADASHHLNVITAVDSRQSVVDQLVLACRSLESAPTDRRVVVALLRRRDGDGSADGADRLSEAMRSQRVAVWPIEVGSTGTQPLDRVLADAVKLGGAVRQQVAAPQLTDAASRLVNLLLSQYVVTYTWPNPMLSQVSIAIRHDRGVVLAPAWTR